MEWDIVFLVKSWPEKYRIFANHVFMVNVGQDWLDTMGSTAGIEDIAIRFIKGVKPEAFAAVGIHINNAKDKKAAVEQAYERLQYLTDGITILLANEVTSICPLVFVRCEKEEHTKIVSFVAGGIFATIVPKPDSESAKIWENRNKTIMQELLHFWDVTESKEARSPLEEQIIFSAKMYRKGAESSDFGVQFLCKFCALEGLVCGAERNGKKEKLNKRLSKLFSPECFAGMEILGLWDLRCDIAHESKLSSESVYIESIDRLFLAAFIHALRKQSSVKTVSELWNDCSALPQEITMNRPADMQRMAIISGIEEYHLRSNGFGRIIDKCLEETRSALSSSKPLL